MVTAHLVASTLASLAYLLRHSPTAREEPNRSGRSIVARKASEVMGPTPGAKPERSAFQCAARAASSSRGRIHAQVTDRVRDRARPCCPDGR